MTCECVKITYPSEKLKPLLDSAVIYCKQQISDIDNRLERRTRTYSELPWYKQIFTKDPDYCFNYGHNSNYRDKYQNLVVWTERIKELNKIRICANYSDTLSLSGECLATIDELAGN